MVSTAGTPSVGTAVLLAHLNRKVSTLMQDELDTFLAAEASSHYREPGRLFDPASEFHDAARQVEWRAMSTDLRLLFKAYQLRLLQLSSVLEGPRLTGWNEGYTNDLPGKFRVSLSEEPLVPQGLPVPPAAEWGTRARGPCGGAHDYAAFASTSPPDYWTVPSLWGVVGERFEHRPAYRDRSIRHLPPVRTSGLVRVQVLWGT